MTPRPSAADRQALREAFAATSPDLSFTERLTAAYKATRLTPRRFGPDNKYYPSQFPWLGVKPIYSHAKPNPQHHPKPKSKTPPRQAGVPSMAPAPRPPAARAHQPSAQSQARPGTSSVATVSPLSAAIDQLAASIVDTVLARVEWRLAAAIVDAAPAKLSNPTKTTPPNAPAREARPHRESAPEHHLQTLSDDQLRDRIGLAKARGDFKTVNQCTALLRRRDIAAGNIANHNQEE